ncbi:MAG: enoyl-CoA hydratase/isomerase family protein [Ignavibacteria bacterium]|nr:enoyl-CoA hydratase/isomerase family protein [Ignavibacteria bacterium]
MEAFVKKEVINSVGIITFFHPKGNSLPSNLLNELEISIKELSSSDEAKVLLLRSEGERAFCAGASFEELVSLENFEEAKKFFSGFGKVINAIRNSSKFVLCRVQGKVVGGGVGLVAACDYVFATRSASARLSELSIGIGPFVISLAVERKIGKAAFSQMSIDTEWYDAQWCYEKGLYNRIFESIEAMDKFIDTFLETLTSRNIKAQMELKRLLWEGTENWDLLLEKKAEISAKLVLDETTQNTIRNLI